MYREREMQLFLEEELIESMNNELESPGNNLGYGDMLLRITAQRKILREGNSEYRL